MQATILGLIGIQKGTIILTTTLMYQQVLHEKMVILLDLDEAIEWYCKAHKLNAEKPGFVPPPVKDAY